MTAAPLYEPVLKSLHGTNAKRRPVQNVGKAEVLWEETGKCTTRAAGVGVQARRKGFAEITSGRSHSQQGLTATCKDLPYKEIEVSRRDWDWRISPKERRGKGNSFLDGGKRHPRGGNTPEGQRGFGHLAVPGVTGHRAGEQ